MSTNRKATSERIGTLAARTLQDSNASQVQRSLAASALAQRSTGRQTGTTMEDVAARALARPTSAPATRTLAASVLAQANKQR